MDSLPSVVTSDDYGGYKDNYLPRAAELSVLDMEKMLLSWQWELLVRVLSTAKPPLGEAHPMQLKRPLQGGLKQRLLYQLDGDHLALAQCPLTPGAWPLQKC